MLRKTQVLHLLAMARAADIPLTIDDFQEVADRTPYLADLKSVTLKELQYYLLIAMDTLDHQVVTTWRICTRLEAFPPS
jgi:hypothetical protein